MVQERKRPPRGQAPPDRRGATVPEAQRLPMPRHPEIIRQVVEQITGSQLPPFPEGMTIAEKTEALDQMVQQLGRQIRQPPQPSQAPAWRPACCNCLNNQKVAVTELAQAMQSEGLEPGSPEYQQRYLQAQQEGAQLLPGMPVPPGALPPVFPADAMVNGNSICQYCFPASRQSRLALGSANMSLASMRT